MANMISALPKSFTNKIKFYRNEVLGKGNSVVYRGTYKDKDVAVKRIELLTDCCTPNEFIHHAKLQHENVIKMLTVEDDVEFRYIVLELCIATLYDVMNNKYHGFLPPDNEVIFQIATGLNYIHSQNLVHLDIKPQNILISKEGQTKLGDLGSSMETEDGICVINGSSRGTYAWMAPEVCQVKGNSVSVQVSAKADVFACGCVIFALLTRNENGWIHPFGNMNDPAMVQGNISEDRPINKDKLEHNLLANVVKQMTENNPENRTTLEDVIEKLLLNKQYSI